MRGSLWFRRAFATLPVLVVLVLFCSGTALAAEGSGSGLDPIVPNGKSPNGHHIWQLYLLVSIPALFIFLLVEGLLITVLIKFRRKKLPKGYKPPQWHGHRGLEVLWTVIPALILIVIGSASFITLQNDYTAQASNNPDIDIAVTGHQYGWQFKYPEAFTVDSEGLTPTPMVIPTSKLVRLKLNSTGVIHGFWVPDLTGKTDLVPGYENVTWVKVSQPGEWRGECTELCGTGHYTMQLRVKAVSQSDYAAFVQKSLADQAKSKSSPSPRAPGAAPAAPAGSPPASPSAGPTTR
ncbi:MAG: cytochrome c oxidase subunit II [Candidatus Dormibacteraeota bacterium]|nr:cytochrome c oxidase subunit II [Candidatus Dormibacteraeota bacterium]